MTDLAQSIARFAPGETDVHHIDLADRQASRALPFADKSIGVVVCDAILEQVPPADWIALAGEIRRVARHYAIRSTASRARGQFPFVGERRTPTRREMASLFSGFPMSDRGKSYTICR
jgi:hypothetical protein